MSGYLLGLVLAVTLSTGELTRMANRPTRSPGLTNKHGISEELTTEHEEQVFSTPKPTRRRYCYYIDYPDPGILSDTDIIGYEDDDDEINQDPSSEPNYNCELRVYDADKEAEVIKEWHDMVKDPIDENTAVKELLLESCNDDEKNLEGMCNAFVVSKFANKCVPGLTKAECLAVTMYTAEGGGFYKEYNNASAHGVWAPYRVYTSLLFSAVKKLAAIEPVSYNENLYRGMRVTCRPPNATRIFWKTFTSTSLNEHVAGFFGTDTSLVFQSPATIFGARIRNLSLMENEDEVLIAPFEVFNFNKVNQQTFYFSISNRQDLLSGRSSPLLPFPGIVLLNLILFLSGCAQ